MADTDQGSVVRVPEAPHRSGLDGFFGITDRGSTVRTEIAAGLTTWLTMAYILFVNPAILGAVKDSQGVSLTFPEVLTVTALVAGVMTLAMGIYGKYPFAIAAGLGLNAFVAFTLVGTLGLTWPQAMGVIVAEGVADHDLRAHRGPGADPQRDPDGSEASDRHRHRVVHRADRARERGRRGRRREPADPDDRAEVPDLEPGVVRVRAPRDERARGPAREGRAADRDRRDHRGRHDRERGEAPRRHHRRLGGVAGLPRTSRRARTSRSSGTSTSRSSASSASGRRRRS